MTMNCLLDEQILANAPYAHITVHNRALMGDLHTHTFYEIILLISGRVTHQLNEQTYSLGEGDLVWMKPYDAHQYIDQSEELDLFSIQVSAEEVQRFLNAYGAESIIANANQSGFLTLSASETRSIMEICTRMLGQNSDKRILLYRMLMGKLMHCLLNRALQGDIPNYLRLAMDQMCSLRNAAEGVSAFLRLSNLSHAQLCRLMKKHCGITPQQFVKEIRLNLAYQMIESTDDDFLSISMEVGYNSFSHFCSAFKEKYGLSPSELRRQSLIRLTADFHETEI